MAKSKRDINLAKDWAEYERAEEKATTLTFCCFFAGLALVLILALAVL